MIKVFISSFRITFVLSLLSVAALAALFVASPDVKPFEIYAEKKIKSVLQAEQFDITNLRLGWDSGPVIRFGKISMETPSLTIHESVGNFTFSLERIFSGIYLPEFKLSGGHIAINFDIETDHVPNNFPVLFSLDDVDVHWTLNQERNVFKHVIASAYSRSDISFRSEGITLSATFNDKHQPEHLSFNISNFSELPESWSRYFSNIQSFNVTLNKNGNKAWLWSLDTAAENQGNISIPDAHFIIPLTKLNGEGSLSFQDGQTLKLKQLEASSLHWKDGENFGDFSFKWSNDVLHIEASDGSTTMPMLWSWLWMLGDGSWHDWLKSMHKGRLGDVRATLDLPWQDPIQKMPTPENIDQMTYHVTTKIYDADVALGLAGDYLYQVDAHVEIDQNHLEAKITDAVLNNGIGHVKGDYAIAWNTLMMDIEAGGLIDVRKLHAWLDKDSASKLNWGQAQATASVSMKWNAEKDDPDQIIVRGKPTGKGWSLSPMDVPLKVEGGEVFYSLNKGLNLKGMVVKSSRFNGHLNMLLDHEDWSLQSLQVDGSANLASLAESLALPVVKPEGKTSIKLNYKQGQWLGELNFSKNKWKSFAGFSKPNADALMMSLNGKPTGKSLLPIQIEQLSSKRDGFIMECKVLIDANRLDFEFSKIQTAAFDGNMRLMLPFDEKLSWGIEVHADYLERGVADKYLLEIQDYESSSRPWSILANVKRLEWDGKNYADQVHFQFSSAQDAAGVLTSETLVAGEGNLQHLKASFTVLEHGKFDLHNLEADGSGQHITISGSVISTKDEVFHWQGIALVQGKFGTLMHQAELDKLLQEGQMTAMFLGKGEFKEGEPWWRGMDGSFRLRVNEGRVMEGGTLTHLLAAMSLVDLPRYLIFHRKDVVGNGLLYDKMQIEAAFDENNLRIKQLAFKSSALAAGGYGDVDLSKGEIDMLLIARPWQNIEAIVGSIPLLGYVLTGEDKSFLRKVYHIHGPASNAAVVEISPQDAGLPSSGLLENLFTLPSRWFGD